jgi:hypothetical protein
MLSRRQFIKTGVIGGVVLVAVRVAYGPFSADPSVAEDRDYSYAILRAKERTVLAAIAPVMLDGALPEESAARQRAIIEVVRGVDTAIRGLPPAVQSEVRDLFALLVFPVTRRVLAGVMKPWLDATPVEIAGFLERWRTSSFALLRTAYRALQELIMAAWYGNPEAWPRISYPGPPAIP